MTISRPWNSDASKGLWDKPIRKDDPTIELIQAKGDLHEAAYLDRSERTA